MIKVTYYKCEDCGHIFKETDIAVRMESRGEFWGVPCEEEMRCCPVCGGSFEKAAECKMCGEWFSRNELVDGLCESCEELMEGGDNDEEKES